MKKFINILIMLTLLVACTKTEETINNNQEDSIMKDTTLMMKIDDEIMDVEWLDNESVQYLYDKASKQAIIIEMSRYGGFEQVGNIGETIPRNDINIKTSAGDIVLYSGNQLVVFYGSNSWSYTKLGKIINKNSSQLEKLLSKNDVVIELYVE